MEPVSIEDPSSLESFLKNKHTVLFYSKSEQDDVVSKVDAKDLTEEEISETHFGTVKGQALYDHLLSMFPLREDKGVILFKNNRMEHQLVEPTYRFFKQCVKDIHLSTTLPPISPSLTCNFDMYLDKSAISEPLILPPAKSFDESILLRRSSTATISSNKEESALLENSPEPQAAQAVPETKPNASGSRGGARADDAPSCCIVM
ncbi:hypothetical protein IWW36_001328 [Coemansia brasiliensis]|uniref:Uncharacterized protein n=1 Tax=Coemansia brasiliensis TaxID=2650707 RepID=A0A9W8M0H8_9FUNG|nr:hypothetical protein IWW36_001328 [Coemansia brasiliensis]